LTKRLLDQNPQRERRRQERILLVLERRFARRFGREILVEINRQMDFFKITGELLPTDARHLERLMVIELDLSKAASKAFGGRVLSQGKAAGIVFEKKFDFSSFFQNVALQYISNEAIRKRITNISETTRSQIVRQVANGQDDGLGVVDIAKNISNAAAGISRTRGAVIARTETHGAANNGADAAARKTGLTLKKEWIAVQDARTRDPHKDVDGTIVGMDERFFVGNEFLSYPGDPSGRADNVINCRCAIGHIVDDTFINNLRAD